MEQQEQASPFGDTLRLMKALKGRLPTSTFKACQLSAVQQAHRAVKLLAHLQFSSLNLANRVSWRKKM